MSGRLKSDVEYYLGGKRVSVSEIVEDVFTKRGCGIHAADGGFPLGTITDVDFVVDDKIDTSDPVVIAALDAFCVTIEESIFILYKGVKPLDRRAVVYGFTCTGEKGQERG